MRETPRETALRVMKEIGVQAKIGVVKEIRRNGQFKRECELEVRMEKMEGKMKVLGKKRNRKGKREIIEEDFTWKQQRMQWLIRRVAEKEREMGKRVKVRYGRLIVNERIWYWDEEKSMLRDGRGRKLEQTKREEESRGGKKRR